MRPARSASSRSLFRCTRRDIQRRSRAPELEVDVPLLVLQGARDPFGGPDQFPAGVAVYEVAGADHRLAGPALAIAVSVAVDWLSATLAG